MMKRGDCGAAEQQGDDGKAERRQYAGSRRHWIPQEIYESAWGRPTVGELAVWAN